MKRFHVHVHVEDLAKNIAFYSAMFNEQLARTRARAVLLLSAA
jgi:lactoylglutathione lyase